MKRLAPLVITLGIGLSQLSAAPLVSPASVKIWKDATHVYRLDNRVPVIYRQIPGAELLNIGVMFFRGQRDFPPNQYHIDSLTAAVMTRATRKYNREQLAKEVERLSIELSCTGGTEYSYCDLGTTKDDWRPALDVFTSAIVEPSFADEDVTLMKDRVVAALRSASSDPASVSADAADQLLYPKDHPLYGSITESIAYVPTIKPSQLQDWHSKFLNSSQMAIVVLGDLPKKDLLKAMNEKFGKVTDTAATQAPLLAPTFDARKDNFVFIERPTSTAYITMGFNAPSAKAADSAAFQLVVSILNSNLFDEVRSKRSLSYSVSANYTKTSIGEGTLSASTSKPNEIFPAIAAVIEDLQKNELKTADLEERKVVFTTHFFRTLQSNRSLGNAIIANYYQQADPLFFYDLPDRIARVSPLDIKNAARLWLNNFRVAMVFEASKFNKKVAQSFIKKFTVSDKAKHKIILKGTH